MKILLLFFLMSINTLLYAGAAEKWEYEPVMKDMNINVTAHKVDQYGDAVNDLTYKTKIDPTTAANKTKMGTVGFGRLLKTTGWGLLGSAALEALLEAVDWVIDPETQSIWRHKKPKTDSSGVSEALCKGGTLKNYSGQDVKILLWTSTYTVGDCPLQAAESLLKYYSNNDGRTYEFIRWLPEKDVDAGYLNYRKVFLYKDPQYGNREGIVQVKTGEVVQPKPEKEYLTPEALADYANHTHPDYSNPELAPKLEPKYSPEIASDLWKPSNSWEETNSPTVEEVEKQLEKSSPESTEQDVEPKTDEEGNPTGAFSLPAFCSWATAVCDFFKWSKENTDLDNEQPEQPDTSVLDREFDTSFNASASCPPNPSIQITDNYNMELPFNKICDFFGYLKFGVLTASSLIACWIVSAAVRGGD